MLMAIVLLVVGFFVLLGILAIGRAIWDAMSRFAQLSTIATAIGGIGYAFGGVPIALTAVGVFIALCTGVMLKWLSEQRATQRRDEAAKANAERDAKRQQQDMARVQAAYPGHWPAQRVWNRPGWLDARNWQEEGECLSELLGPPDILVTRELDDDIGLFIAARVRNIEAAYTFLADVRRTRAKELRKERQCTQQERRRQEIERAAQEAKRRAHEARMAQQIVIALDDLPGKHGRE
jgi:hypothetical protein